MCCFFRNHASTRMLVHTHRFEYMHANTILSRSMDRHTVKTTQKRNFVEMYTFIVLKHTYKHTYKHTKCKRIALRHLTTTHSYMDTYRYAYTHCHTCVQGCTHRHRQTTTLTYTDITILLKRPHLHTQIWPHIWNYHTYIHRQAHGNPTQNT